MAQVVIVLVSHQSNELKIVVLDQTILDTRVPGDRCTARSTLLVRPLSHVPLPKEDECKRKYIGLISLVAPSRFKGWSTEELFSFCPFLFILIGFTDCVVY